MLNTKSSKKQLEVRNLISNLKLFKIIINNFLEITEEILMSYLENIGMAWWVEIVTKTPDCKYYFGPFVSHRQAQLSQLGYIEDLERERPKLISIEIKQCQPKELTIFEDEWIEKIDINISQAISA